jgi:hypothetical protein
MDMRIYYRKIRETLAVISDVYVVMVSHETPDGGVAGVRTEVTREIAARMIVEERARLATPEEAEEYRRQQWEALHELEERAARERVHVTLVSERPQPTRRNKQEGK